MEKPIFAHGIGMVQTTCFLSTFMAACQEDDLSGAVRRARRLREAFSNHRSAPHIPAPVTGKRDVAEDLVKPMEKLLCRLEEVSIEAHAGRIPGQFGYVRGTVWDWNNPLLKTGLLTAASALEFVDVPALSAPGRIIIIHLLGLAPEGWLASPDTRA
jgi:hypothetical protein